ncbi:MAG: alpha-N-acetylglucosaminidase [Bacteroidales bacterium]|nr:alpha-N-acetylglucosaminidase [Candidatus Equimonas faecalis]
MRIPRLILLGLCAALAQGLTAGDSSTTLVAFLNRIGGEGAANRFVVEVEPGLSSSSADVFCITASEGKPCIKGSSTLAVTTGVNWYLNHYAHINLSWNQLTTDLTAVPLPLPEAEETHTCTADYRYYLNFCTFGYSMTTWTWERWQQEIDWMALHGINMPLQIVGLEEVWRRVLVQYNYTDDEAKAFAAGPAFTAWWGMNNLEGWGGTTDSAWFSRQAKLGRQIADRERELGMKPVLPGFAATVPSDFTKKNPAYPTESQGNWGGAFTRPYIMDPSADKFPEVAERYYKALHEVLGTSDYYAMDPFHEGGSIRSGKYAEGYRAIFDAMQASCGDGSKWVIQQWQWAGYQATSLTAVPEGRLIVLDLFSDGKPCFDTYRGYAPQEAIYCTIPNFGGRTGMMGRLATVAKGYFTYKKKYAGVRGIGAAPEAIESVPVCYDLLFELPWLTAAPDVAGWVADYALSRYGQENADAARAWDILRTTALNETGGVQGPHETVMCGRPALTMNAVSSWGSSKVFYNQQKFTGAAFDMMHAAATIGTSGHAGAINMSYDLTDVVRQTLSDYAQSLLAAIQTAGADLNSPLFQARKDLFLRLILDTDRLLGTNRLFRLGNWTETARRAAAEVEGATTATADWLELDNARTLITTWGDRTACEWGLRDYSYRQWQGLLRDYYYPRWNYYFNHQPGLLSTPAAGWFYSEWNWAHELQGEWGAAAKGKQIKAERTFYTPEPEGDTRTVAAEVLGRYILALPKSATSTTYAYRGTDNNYRNSLTVTATQGQLTFPPVVNASEVESLAIDFNNDGTLSSAETTSRSLSIDVPADCAVAKVKGTLTLTDGTTVIFGADLKTAFPDGLSAPRSQVAPSAATAIDGRPLSPTLSCRAAQPCVRIEAGRKLLARE